MVMLTEERNISLAVVVVFPFDVSGIGLQLIKREGTRWLSRKNFGGSGVCIIEKILMAMVLVDVI